MTKLFWLICMLVLLGGCSSEYTAQAVCKSHWYDWHETHAWNADLFRCYKITTRRNKLYTWFIDWK